MGINPVAKYTKTDATGSYATWLAGLDANNIVAMREADNFAPRAQDSPDMTVKIDAGHLFNGATLNEVAAQNTGTITAPSGANKRIDRAVIDNITGAVSVVTGTPTAGTPAAPAIPVGKTPICQIGGGTGGYLLSSTTSITNSMITDERNLSMAGTGFDLLDSSSTTSYTFLTSDHKRVKVRSNSGTAMTDSLPQAGTTFPAGWWVEIINSDPTAPITITPTTSTIDGATSTVIKAGRSAKIVSDGTNYYTERGSHGALGPITNIASATTTDLGAAKSNFLNVTGVTTITGFGSTAVAAFPFYILKFAGAVLLTNGANLNINGGANYTTVAGDYGLATVTASGTWDLTIWPVSGRAVVSSGVAYGSIYGCIPSSIAGTSTTASLTVGTGQAADSTNATYIVSAGYSWAVSNGNAINGYQGGTTLPNSSTIHFYLCTGASGTGVFASTSLTPTLPTGYAVSYRRIFSANTSASGALIPYKVVESEGGSITCYLTTQLLDISTTTLISANRTLFTLTVPTGIKVQPLIRFAPDSPSVGYLFTSPDETDVAPSAYASFVVPLWDIAGSTVDIAGNMPLITNTSGQIGARCSSGTSNRLFGTTRGFKDFRRS